MVVSLGEILADSGDKGKHTVTEDHQLLALAGGDLSEQREQVVRDTLGVLTHDTGGVGTGGVEVTEQGTVPLLGLGLVAGLDGVVALSVDHVGDGGLNGELCVAVGVGGAQRALLGDGNHVGEAGGIAVDGGGAGENNVGDVVADHRAQKVDGAVDVDHVVVQGLLAGLADSLINTMSASPSIAQGNQEKPYLEGSEVDNAVDVGVSLEHLVEVLLVGDIELNELGLLAADQLNAVQSLGGGVVQVVSNDDLVASLQQSEGGERANVARATAGGLASGSRGHRSLNL